ncbi:arylacetamide deacetylase-like 2 [Xenia sp. Carnegie-2017]|uniref:arylacetamide deacetylase-like 2 n=1 Tax=Xenia sp. Carnegie-2017 TaxID=2897299 RepID=UPI001F036E7D|nr:arylacetamide deacetylase-like 2 [Xenia sp. Carnegie-2017]
MFKTLVTITAAFVAISTGILWHRTYGSLSDKIEGWSSKVFPTACQCIYLLLDIFNPLLGIPQYKIFRLLPDKDWFGMKRAMWKNELLIEDSTIAGVPVTTFLSHNIPSPSPGIIYFHSGGMVMGSNNAGSSLTLCSHLANKTKAVVISVGYRLAPENVYPASFDDAWNVVSTILSDPLKYNINGSRIALMGESAGGLLAQAVSLKLANHPQIPNRIAAQVLLYPWFQLIDMFCLPSYKLYSEGFVVSDRITAYCVSALTMGNDEMVPMYISGNVSKYFMQTKYWKYLAPLSKCKLNPTKDNITLPKIFIEKVTDQYLSPLLADDLSSTPPTLLGISEYDILESESSLMSQRLKEAGVNIITKRYKTYHGFVMNLGIPMSNKTLAKLALNDTAVFLNAIW